MLRSTGQTKKPDAIGAAHRLILEEYRQVAPSAERMDWDAGKKELRDALEADGKRPATVKGYLETLDKLIDVLPIAKGPADVSEKMADDFKTKYAKGRLIRAGNGQEGRGRKPKSLDSRLRTLKAVFTWFKKLHVVDANPFTHVSQPELDRHEVKFVRESDVVSFFDWLRQRYPGWRMPILFFTVKALTGCRLDDLCSIRSNQLQDGRIVFAADATKNRSERYALLPPEVFAELDGYKGRTPFGNPTLTN